MKIYCEPLGKPDEIEAAIKTIIEKVPANLPEQVHFTIKTLTDLALVQYEKSMVLHQENARLRCMWDLRSLEQEMDAEDGRILIRAEGRPEINGFSLALRQKIENIIHPQ